MKSKIYLFLFFLAPMLLPAQDEGADLFKTKCRACHNIDKKLVGPPLEGVSAKREKAWLYQFINGSQDMVDSGDPDAVAIYNEYNGILMPDQNLTEGEIDAIFSYIDGQATAAKAENPIKRPDLGERFVYRNIQFDNYGFWIPYSIMVVALILGLYYMTVSYDILHDKSSSTQS